MNVHRNAKAFIEFDKGQFEDYGILQIVDFVLSFIRQNIVGTTPYRKDMKTCGQPGHWKILETGSYYISVSVSSAVNSIYVNFVPRNVRSRIYNLENELVHDSNISIDHIETDFDKVLDTFIDSPETEPHIKNYELKNI